MRKIIIILLITTLILISGCAVIKHSAKSAKIYEGQKMREEYADYYALKGQELANFKDETIRLAIEAKDSTICEDRLPPMPLPTRDYCNSEVGVALQDEEICNKLLGSSGGTKLYCLAGARRDSSICLEIDEGSIMRDVCLKKVESVS